MHNLFLVILLVFAPYISFAQVPKENYQTTINGWALGVMSLDSIAIADSLVVQNESYTIISFELIIDPKRYGDPFIAKISGDKIIYLDRMKALNLDDRIIIDNINCQDIYGQKITVSPISYVVTK